MKLSRLKELIVDHHIYTNVCIFNNADVYPIKLDKKEYLKNIFHFNGIDRDIDIKLVQAKKNFQIKFLLVPNSIIDFEQLEIIEE